MSSSSGLRDEEGSACPGASATECTYEQSARARASLFELLTSFFRDEPSESTLEAMRSSPFRDALKEAGMELEEAFFSEDIKSLREKLMVEFAELFLVPGSLISPHEAVQVSGGSGQLRGPETAQVKRYYEGLGFEVDETTPLEPDHISIEAEFLRHLCEQEANAWAQGDRAKAIDALRYQQDFLNRHLGKWAFGFLGKIEQNATHSFYRELARLTRAFLDEEKVSMLERLKTLES